MSIGCGVAHRVLDVLITSLEIREICILGVKEDSNGLTLHVCQAMVFPLYDVLRGGYTFPSDSVALSLRNCICIPIAAL